MKKYQIKKEHTEIVRSYENLTKFIILRFESLELKIKDKIIRNFIAKSFSLLNSIYILIDHNQEREAMALYRLLVERYLYLEYLNKTESYQEFDDWSFIKASESRNGMRSNPEFNDSATKKFLKDTKEQVKNYQRLKEKNKWKEPNLEQLAKELNSKFLYNFGYDLGSSYIHPRAEEGLLDALRIVKNEIIEPFRLENTLKNSILISNSILMLGLHYSNFDWNGYLYKYCDIIYKYLRNEIELPNIRDFEKIITASLLVEIETTVKSHKK